MKAVRTGQTLTAKQLTGPVLWGVLGSLGLLTFYLGLITLAQGWQHAFEQLGQDILFTGSLVAGFGLEIGLFVYLRQLHTRARVAGVAASTHTSAAAMLACVRPSPGRYSAGNRPFRGGPFPQRI
ncbi:MAG: hypothetical protein J0I20_22915 [Chloroflexi bacterium]|mgnify:CR=1 FL=1|nr:hypothetical protein [Chloroflexota bacterium]OJV93033.1 MAG: hypothetical protein BGO39_21205 [Chloroflexi bacterium 54-19]